MPRRSKYNLEAIRALSNVECPHCNVILSPADYLRLDSERLRCVKCGKDLYPAEERRPADADKLKGPLHGDQQTGRSRRVGVGQNVGLARVASLYTTKKSNGT